MNFNAQAMNSTDANNSSRLAVLFAFSVRMLLKGGRVSFGGCVYFTGVPPCVPMNGVVCGWVYGRSFSIKFTNAIGNGDSNSIRSPV